MYLLWINKKIFVCYILIVIFKNILIVTFKSFIIVEKNLLIINLKNLLDNEIKNFLRNNIFSENLEHWRQWNENPRNIYHIGIM